MAIMSLGAEWRKNHIRLQQPVNAGALLRPGWQYVARLPGRDGGLVLAENPALHWLTGDCAPDRLETFERIT